MEKHKNGVYEGKAFCSIPGKAGVEFSGTYEECVDYAANHGSNRVRIHYISVKQKREQTKPKEEKV